MFGKSPDNHIFTTWTEDVFPNLVFCIRRMKFLNDYHYSNDIVNIEKRDGYDYITPNNKFPKQTYQFKYVFRKIIDDIEFMVSDMVIENDEYKLK